MPPPAATASRCAWTTARTTRTVASWGAKRTRAALTPRYAFAATVGGLNVRDVVTGELLWRSPGFAPRGCVNPALANGRVFWPSAASGMIYCWEPEGPFPR